MVGDQRPFETLLKGKANWQGAGGKVRNNWQGDHGVSVISNFLRLDRVETRPQSQITISGIKRSNSLFIKFVDFGISSCNLYFRFKQMNRSEGSLEHAKLAQASKGFRRVRVVKLWAVLKAHFKIGNPDFPHQSFPNCLGVGSFTRRLPPPPWNVWRHFHLSPEWRGVLLASSGQCYPISCNAWACPHNKELPGPKQEPFCPTVFH